MVLNLELARPKNHGKTSSKWLHPATLLIMTSYHKCMPVNFKVFFWIALQQNLMTAASKLTKLLFYVQSSSKLWAYYWLLFPSTIHSGIFIHYSQNFSKRKESEDEDLELSIGCWNPHLRICALFWFSAVWFTSNFNASSVKQSKSILIFILKSTASVISVNQY